MEFLSRIRFGFAWERVFSSDGVPVFVSKQNYTLCSLYCTSESLPLVRVVIANLWTLLHFAKTTSVNCILNKNNSVAFPRSAGVQSVAAVVVVYCYMVNTQKPKVAFERQEAPNNFKVF